MSKRVGFFYGLSTLGSAATGFLISSWLTYFYLPPDGIALVPVAWFGIAVFSARAIGAILPPVVGYLSDRATHPRGRRLPFMFLAAFPMLAFFVLLWTPPVSTPSIWNLLYLASILLLHRLSWSFYHVPYQALLPELASDDQRRIRMSAWQSGFMLVGYMLGGAAGPVIDSLGFRLTALIYAGAALFTFYLPFAFMREQTNRSERLPEKANVWSSFFRTLRNPNFTFFSLVWALFLMTSTFIQSSVPFIATEVCLLSQSDTVLFYLPAVLVSLLCYPIITELSEKYGKWKVYAGSLLAAALVFPSLMLVGPWFSTPLRTQCVIWAISQAAAISGAVVLSTTFIAEITDYDTLETGERREGMYYATSKVFEDVFNGVAMALLPLILLLGRSQESPGGPLGVRLTGLVSGILMLAAFFMFLRYPNRKLRDGVQS